MLSPQHQLTLIMLRMKCKVIMMILISNTLNCYHNHLTAALSTPSVSLAKLTRSARTLSRATWCHAKLYSTSDNKNNEPNDENETKSNGSNELKKRLVFLGSPEVAATTLRAIYERTQKSNGCSFEVVGVVTQPPKRRIRKGKVEPTPVGIVAEALGIPHILCPESAKSTDFLSELETVVRPDVCITAAYGQYLPKKFLSIPPFGTINIHPSLLPKWRGASPVQRSLQAGDNPVGVSVLYTVSKMDAGPIIQQQEVYIDKNDTASNVLPMLFEIGTNLLLDSLPKVLDGTITFDTAMPQDENNATAASMIDSSEAEMKVWEESATQCHNKVRGFSMWPQTHMWFQIFDPPTSSDIPNHDDNAVTPISEPMKVKIIKTKVVEQNQQSGTPSTEIRQRQQHDNTIVTFGPTKSSGLYVTCYDGSILELLEVQPVTRKVFPARDFQNGYPGKVIKWIRTPAPALENEEHQVEKQR